MDSVSSIKHKMEKASKWTICNSITPNGGEQINNFISIKSIIYDEIVIMDFFTFRVAIVLCSLSETHFQDEFCTLTVRVLQMIVF